MPKSKREKRAPLWKKSGARSGVCPVLILPACTLVDGGRRGRTWTRKQRKSDRTLRLSSITRPLTLHPKLASGLDRNMPPKSERERPCRVSSRSLWSSRSVSSSAALTFNHGAHRSSSQGGTAARHCHSQGALPRRSVTRPASQKRTALPALTPFAYPAVLADSHPTARRTRASHESQDQAHKILGVQQAQSSRQGSRHRTRAQTRQAQIRSRHQEGTQEKGQAIVAIEGRR